MRREKGGLYKNQCIMYRGVILCIMLILFGCGVANKIEDKQRQQLLLYEADIEKTSEFIDRELLQLCQSMSMFNNQVWVDKLASTNKVFEEEFTVFKRKEISESLLEKKTLHAWIKEAALIFPYKDIVVSGRGWYSLEEYRNYLKKSGEDFEQVIDKFIYTHYAPQFLRADGASKLIFIESVENTLQPKGTSIFWINEEAFEKDILQMTHGRFLKLEVAIDNEVVAVVGAGDKTEPYYLSKSIDSKMFNLKYHFYYDKYLLAFTPLELMILGFKGIGYIILGLSIGEVMLYLARKPIKKVLMNVNKMTDLAVHESPYEEGELIEKCIENLLREKEKMTELVNQYSYGARNNFLIKLLRGYFDERSAVEALQITEMAYHEEGYYAVCILGVNDESEGAQSKVDLYQSRAIFTIALKNLEKSFDASLQLVETLQSDTVIIMALTQNNGSVADRIYLEMLQVYQSIFNKIPCSVLGSVERGLLGISKSYDYASAKKNELLFNKKQYTRSNREVEGANYYYPTDWEIQLINNIKISNLEVAQTILNQIKEENDKRHLAHEVYMKLLESILGVLNRIMEELGLEIEGQNEKIIVLDQEDEVAIKWLLINTIVNKICSRTVYSRKTNNMAIANQMLEYINTHYTNPDLSLKKIANHFHVSESGISKTFKEVYKMNFSDYMRRMRMEEAKRLLIETHEKITVIAGLVGYENEYSFKRAFMKYEGVKPSEYVLKVKEDAYLTRVNKSI